MYVSTPQPTPRGYIQHGAENFSPEARQMLFNFMIDSPEEITHDSEAIGCNSSPQGSDLLSQQVQDTNRPRQERGPVGAEDSDLSYGSR